MRRRLHHMRIMDHVIALWVLTHRHPGIVARRRWGWVGPRGWKVFLPNGTTQWVRTFDEALEVVRDDDGA